MNRFDVSTRTSKVTTSIIAGIVGGALIAFACYYVLSWFPNAVAASTAMSISVGVGALAAVGGMLNTLFSTVKRVRVDGQGVYFQMLMGGVKAYPLQGSTFEPVVVHNTHNGRHTTSVRSLRIHGPDGTDTHRLDIEPSEYSDLVHLLTGAHLAAAPGGATAAAAMPAGQGSAQQVGPRQPLQFQPRQFALQPGRGTRRATLPLTILAGVLILFGLALFALSLTQNDAGVGAILLAVLGVPGLLCLIAPVIVWSRSRGIPRSVVVTPTSVTFGDRTFAYADCKVIQIKPAGTPVDRSVKILTAADEKVVVPLGLNRYVKIFPDYDEFASLLHQAGTAAAGVVRLDYS